MKKRLFYLLKFGQLDNQLYILAHLLAFLKKCGYQIIFPDSTELSGIVKIKTNTLSAPDLTFRPVKGVFRLLGLTKLLHYLLLNSKLSLGHTLIINTPFKVDEHHPFTMSNRILLSNWLFKYYSGVTKHQEYVRSKLAFKDELIAASKTFIETILREHSNSKLIGVHVRRGDYATWLNGKYYYSTPTYYSKLVEIADLVLKSIFLINSNELIDFNNEDKYTIYYCNGSTIEDLHSLSCCDYIMGPPSTFSGWAAFMGSSPLFFIQNTDKIKSMDLFEPHYL